MKRLLPHIEFAELVRRAERRSSAPDEHLDNCRECQSNFHKLQKFFSFATSPALENVPQATTARLLNIFQPAKQTRRKTLKSRLRGILIFDDWLPEFAVHERLAFSDTRQMLFQAADYQIDLRLNFFGGKCQITGQIFPDCADGEIEISSADDTEKVSLNEYCEFVFPFVAEGIYDFRLYLKDTEIELSQISLVS